MHTGSGVRTTRHVALATALGAATLLAACLLPSDPSTGERIAFRIDGDAPLRVPLGESVRPAITVVVGERVLPDAPYRLESVDASVVRVDASGQLLTGLRRDTTSVRVVYPSATGLPDTLLRVRVVVSQVAIAASDTSESLSFFTRLGDTASLRATAFDAAGAEVRNVDFAWTSDDTSVATVDAAGLITAVNDGVATISAELDEVTAERTVRVAQVAAMVRIAPELDTVRTVYRSTQLSALAFDSTGLLIRRARPRWASTDPAVAEVDARGVVTAMGPGTARITAAVGDAADTATLVVAQAVRFVVLSPRLDTLRSIGDTVRFTASAFDSNGVSVPNPPLQWRVADPGVASVDGTGLASALANGVTLIEVVSGGFADYGTAVVSQEAVALELDRTSVDLVGSGSSARLTAIARDANGYPIVPTEVSWTSRAGFIATVDAEGLVTARMNGRSLITASTRNGISSDAMVTVSMAADPGLLVFHSPGGIEAMLPDGSSRGVFLANEEGRKWGDPAWSPDGSRFAFATPFSGQPVGGIRLADLGGSGVVDLSAGTTMWEREPAWSPDGTRLVFTRSPFPMPASGENDDIFVMSADGSGRRFLARGNSPSWSPDGASIVYSVWPTRNSEELWVVDADGTNARLLSKGCTVYCSFRHPAWSPDGTRIAFVDDDWGGGAERLAIMDADGRNKRQLTPVGLTVFHPSWSPDGSFLVFAASLDGLPGSTDLYLIRADGTGLVRLTDTPGSEGSPSWRPATATPPPAP